jgi:hypothetical protein
MKNIIALCLVAALGFLGSARVKGADNTKPARTEKPVAKARSLPFRGKLAAVDKKAGTIKVGERIFHVTAETRIVKDEKAATLADGVVGDKVGGAYLKESDGTLRAVSLRFGDKPASSAKTRKTKKSPKSK